MDMLTLTRTRIEESLAVKRALLDVAPVIAQAGETLVKAYKTGGQAFFFGNGGSAADAQHLAAEMLGKFYKDRPALPAQALSTNTSSLTAIGNDYSYDYIFARQIEGLGRKGDVAVGISTSGNSKNVIDALIAAKKKGMLTIGFAGEGGGRMRELCDVCVCVPSKDTARIQECHILVGHLVCEMVEAAMMA